MGEYEEYPVGREKSFIISGNADVEGIASELGKALDCEFELKRTTSDGKPYGFAGYIPHFLIDGFSRFINDGFVIHPKVRHGLFASHEVEYGVLIDQIRFVLSSI